MRDKNTGFAEDLLSDQTKVMVEEAPQFFIGIEIDVMPISGNHCPDTPSVEAATDSRDSLSDSIESS